MLPILSGAQIRAVESISMECEPISSLDLMERAGTLCFNKIKELTESGEFGKTPSFLVIVGMGNNGGDGLVIARLLFEADLPVRVIQIAHRPEPSVEHAANYQKLITLGESIIEINSLSRDFEYDENEVIIDCILGSGAKRAPAGLLREVIHQLNSSGRPVISIDLPSGMLEPGSSSTFDPNACIRADRTYTFEVPRLALLLPETGAFAGEWELLPIGLDTKALESTERLGNWVQPLDVRSRLKPRGRFSHKGTYGHALIVGGSKGVYGAALLATEACLRSGAGLVTAHVPSDLASSFSVPEALCSPDGSREHISGLPGNMKFSAVGLGPGLGMAPESAAMLQGAITSFEMPLVLDADALNMLAANRNWLQHLSSNMVLTPHPKEMDRLLGSISTSSFDRLERTKAFTIKYGCTVILKGAYTAICSPDGSVFFNSTGNAGMAKGGSGDVLTGLLTGLLAQGYTILDAALIAVHLHGSAGDLAAEDLSMEAMHSGDIITFLPQAWKLLRSH